MVIKISRLDELQIFEKELAQCANLVSRYLGDGLTEEEEKQGSKIYRTISQKVGYLGSFISELSGMANVDIHGKEYDMWLIALKMPTDKLADSALRVCLLATNKAIGKLRDDITKEKRDAQTGELLTKSGISGSEPPEALIAKENWKAIEREFGITKNRFGKKINFVSGSFQRSIIFRDVEHSSVLARLGFSKPAVILAGSVIEELLRLYLEYKNISPLSDNFDGYIRTCEQHGLLKDSVSRLSHSVRQFRNLVHLSAEKTKKHTISKATAIGAVSSIFTIANDF